MGRTDLSKARKDVQKVTKWFEKSVTRLHPIAIDKLVEDALSLAEDARRVAEIARTSRG